LPESEGFRDRRYTLILPRKRARLEAPKKVQNQCKMRHFGDAIIDGDTRPFNDLNGSWNSTGAMDQVV
jgi:hypothetical protein